MYLRLATLAGQASGDPTAIAGSMLRTTPVPRSSGFSTAPAPAWVRARSRHADDSKACGSGSPGGDGWFSSELMNVAVGGGSYVGKFGLSGFCAVSPAWINARRYVAFGAMVGGCATMAA